MQKTFLALGLCCCTFACHTISDVDNGKVYLRGRGVAKYHLYKSVGKCQTAFGLDPSAFDGMVTAVAFPIAAQFPRLAKVGKRSGPYDPSAHCIRVREVGKSTSIVVRAIDKCCTKTLGSAQTHQLDLADDAFAKLAPLARGNLSVEWAVVDCPNSLRVKSDSAVCDDNYYFSR
ncbi:MAG: hypothetical protein H7249_04525 [Chitinophagaceae bacterium]|nr:hypothetical protein [Oligoflexus sp.]